MFQVVIFQSLLALSGGYYINISTPNTIGYIPLLERGVDIRNTSHIRFAVRACNDVHVGLAKNEGEFDTQIIEIVIGGWSNTKTVLRISPQGAPKEELGGSFLDCGVAKEFWIDWYNTTVRLGRGATVNNYILLSYQTLSHPINYLGIYTAYGSEGLWSFEIPDHASDRESSTINPNNLSMSPSPTSLSSASFTSTLSLTGNYADSTSYLGQQDTTIYPSSIFSYTYIQSSSTSLDNSEKSITPYSEVNDTETRTATASDNFEFGSTFVNNGITASSVKELSSTTPPTDIDVANSTFSQTCFCICQNTNLTENDADLKIKELKEILTLNKSKLSSARRRLHSIDDMRPVSVTIGMLMGVSVLTFTFCLIVIPDIVSFVHYLYLCTGTK